VPVGGGVIVVDPNGDAVLTGFTVTESVPGPSSWFAAVQDVDNAPDRSMFVAVTCGQPSSVSPPSKARFFGR
jgi:hypothetical protein